MKSTLTMRAVRVIAVGLMLGALLPLSAHAPAQVPDVTRDAFVADASARALRLALLGNQTPTTLGFSQARVTSPTVAKATGAGKLLDPNTTSVAEITQNNAILRVPEQGRKCAAPPVPIPAQLQPILELGIACSTAEASTQNGVPSSKSTGQILALDLSAGSILNQVIQPIQGPLTQAFGALPDQLDPATNTVADLLKALGSAKTLSAKIGDALSSSSGGDRRIAARGFASAATVDILPNSVQFGDFFIRIEVGSAVAEAVHDRTSGVTSSTADPALVRVLFTKNLAGQSIAPITVAPGADVTLLAGTPLESTISASTARRFTAPDGSVGAIADAVTLHLLKGVSGGIKLELGHAEAAVAGTPLVVTKAVSPLQIGADRPFESVITVQNPYDCPVENVRVEDFISSTGEGRFKIARTSPSADEVTAGEFLSTGKVVWSNIGTIPARGTRTVNVTQVGQLTLPIDQRKVGSVIDFATATGSVACPQSAGAGGAEIVAAALNRLPVGAVSPKVEVRIDETPRTGPESRTTMFAGLALLALAGAGLVTARRFAVR